MAGCRAIEISQTQEEPCNILSFAVWNWRGLRVVGIIGCSIEVAMNESFRDPESKQEPLWIVRFNNQVCSPRFTSKGTADAYLDMLKSGKRKPEYPRDEPTATDALMRRTDILGRWL